MSGREWKPGDVAMIHTKVRQEGRRAVRRGSVWHFLDDEGYAIDAYVTGRRPLVVIDPEDREQVEQIVKTYNNGEVEDEWTDAMQTVFRNLATPPKPDEPTGLGAVVEDAEGHTYVRGYADDHTHPWHVIDDSANKHMSWWQWDDIAIVRVLSPGVTP